MTCTRARCDGDVNPHVADETGPTGSYHGMVGGVLRRLQLPTTAHPTTTHLTTTHLTTAYPAVADPSADAARAHEDFRAMVMDDAYTCVAARSAFRRGDYRFGRYGTFGSDDAARGLAVDLWRFVHEFPIRADRFATFVASFDGPDLTGELAFEDRLWHQLQLLHELDRQHSQWDPGVSADPSERGFSFSFAGRAFFLVGMHPASSRFARRAASPTIVFNAHAQFEILRDSGRMPRMQEINRTRDRRWQGSHNPSLERFEREPETIMYSGRVVESDWVCPLRTPASIKHTPASIRSSSAPVSARRTEEYAT